MPAKSLVLPVEMDKATEGVVDRVVQSTAKGIPRVSRSWQADFLARQAYGPGR